MFSSNIVNGEKRFYINTKLLSDEYQEQIKTLELLYVVDNIVYPFDNRKELKPRKNRVCRFCGNTYPDVTFKNKAHLIPEFLGNKNFLSDYECDTCNRIFARYENDLANYFGPFLTFAGISGKNKVPKFKSNSQSVDVEFNAPFIDVNFKNAEVFRESIGYDEKNHIQKIQYNSKPFTPINIFRALVKIGLSTINKFKEENFVETFDFLLSDSKSIGLEKNSFFNVHKFFVPGNFKIAPIVISLRKNEKFINYPAPTHLLIIQVNNIIIQWFIPFYKEDMFFFKDNKDVKRNLFIVPPLIPEKWLKIHGKPFSEQLYFGSNKRIKSQRMMIEYKNPFPKN